ncbi:sulfate ABC transporter permease [Vibrio fluvialis]|uniref:sulfate ABC transporter permease n=1 Tax=Vibrio fluvialis TaxID=676 RepID=UPI001EECD2E0|nr:sulfate ABC transporter permease [Vibrio fluvialis]EKO3379644.1 sulfate ABC transporter permease [Vibrio fluvialis]EKO3981955.1 sulfate ABC transporter permease [Vibrio fluvialis]MCG6375292.1 sulfate ABC transporter permease [Vibrio fluvialis]
MKTTSLIGLLLFSPLAMSQINVGEHVRVSGFGTVSATKSDTSVPIFVHRNIDDEWCFDCDTTLGLQLDWIINDQWRTSVQTVKRPQDHFSSPELEWAYLESAWGAYSAKVGRLRLPVFMMSEYYYVSVAYPWIRPPQDVYDSLLGITHYDGASFEWNKMLTDASQLRISTFAALPSENDYRLYNTQYTLDASSAYGLTMDWYQDDNVFRIAYLTAEADLKTGSYNISHYDMDLLALGINYALGDYHLFSEYIYDNQLYSNWYVGLARQFGKWQPYAQYGQRRKLYSNDSYLFGLRYNVVPNVAINGEWQVVNSTENIISGHFTREQNPLTGIKTKAHIISLAISFTF